MKYCIFLFICTFLVINKGWCQINVQLLHQLVSENKEEHGKQVTARDRQSKVTATEELNKQKLGKLKGRYRELQQRFHFLGVVIDAAQVGVRADPIVNDIVRHQATIIQEAEKDPLLLPIALDSEADLIKRAKSLFNFLIALTISVGDINQMKVSDRKELFEHVIDELNQISGTSKGLSICLINRNRKSEPNPFRQFVNKDKQFVKGIMNKVAILKNDL
ncbi:hypothetical protein [Desertivirga xinjiangensis]|uniref:hypothetical protein n=1 Tax=Desertivirga xinjiangensis TaxID=539206 RepID=UPI00210A6B63|nr:hypothetical protein [Pedobacter xinjiangensis]